VVQVAVCCNLEQGSHTEWQMLAVNLRPPHERKGKRRKSERDLQVEN